MTHSDSSFALTLQQKTVLNKKKLRWGQGGNKVSPTQTEVAIAKESCRRKAEQRGHREAAAREVRDGVRTITGYKAERDILHRHKSERDPSK